MMPGQWKGMTMIRCEVSEDRMGNWTVTFPDHPDHPGLFLQMDYDRHAFAADAGLCDGSKMPSEDDSFFELDAEDITECSDEYLNFVE